MKLSEEIKLPEYAKLTDAQIADAVNAKSVTVRSSRFITKTSLYAELGFAAGLALIGTFKALAKSPDAATALQFGEILELLDNKSDGLDVSLDEVRGVIDSLTAAEVLPVEVASKIKAMGETTRPAYVSFGFSRPLDFADIAIERGI